ncbi:MAG: hypothetical protein ABIP94_22065 [Planctomycetota bacterium]
MYLRCLLPVLLLAACGADHNPMAGNWSQQLPGNAKGMTIEFDGASDKVNVHTAPREDGGHGHVRGTYIFDAPGRSVTVKAKLAGDDKADTWKGTVDGTRMDLSSADGKLAFQRGGAADGH